MTCALVLDIAMHRTGWALGGDDWERPLWGVFETRNWQDNEAKNLHVFRQFLETQGDTYELTHLVIEKVFVDNRNGGNNFNFNGTQAQLMLSGVALEWAQSRKLHTFQADSNDWRKRFLGLNRKPKDAKAGDAYWKNLALKVAAQRNWFCEYHDEAEALGILDFTLAALSKSYRLRTEKHLARQHQDIDFKMGAHS